MADTKQMSHRPQPTEQRSPTAYFTSPVVVFLGSASLVFGIGSLFLVLIWWTGGRTEPQQLAQLGSESPTAGEVPSATTPATESTEVTPGQEPAQNQLPSDHQKLDAISQQTSEPSEVSNPLSGDPFGPFFKLSLPQREFTDEERRTYFDQKYVPRYSYAPEAGTLAIVGPWQREVGFLTHDVIETGGTQESVKLVKLSGNVVAVDYKPLPDGEKFLVSYASPAGIAIIDAVTLELQKKISLSDESSVSVTCPKSPQVDFAFAFADRGNSYQINVNTLEIVKTWPTCAGPGQATYDGTWVVRNWRGPISVQLADQRGWTHVEHGVSKYNHRTPIPYVDRLGRFVAIRGEIYAPDFKQQLGEYDTIPEAVSVDNSWIFGVEKSELILASLNDGKAIKRFAIPKPWIPRDGLSEHHLTPEGIASHLRRIFSQRGGHTWSDVFRCKIVADDIRKRLLIAGPDLLSIPYAAFDVPPEPRLFLESTPSVSGTIGDTIEFDIPLAVQDASVELVESRGASIQGNRFRWTPKSGQDGLHTFVARISKDHATHLARWNVQVDRPVTETLSVEFFADGVSVSADETTIAVRGHQPVAKTMEDEFRAFRASGEIAVFDAQSRAPKANLSVAFPIEALTFFQNELLAYSPKGNREASITRLKLPDLQIAGEANVESGKLVSIGDKVIGVSNSDRWAYYTMPDMKRLMINGTTRADKDKLSGQRVADGWTFDGLLWGPKMKERRLIYRSAPFASLGSGLSSGPFGDKKTQQIYQGFIYDLPTSVKVNRGGWNDKNSYDSFHLPANIAVEVSNDSCDLVFRSIDNNEERHRLLLMPRPKELSTDRGMQDIAFTKDTIYVVCAGRVFVVDARPLYAMMPRPFHIAPIQSDMVLTGRSPKVKYEAAGATSYQLELVAFQGGQNVTLESTDGEFTIDLSHIDEIATELWAKLPGGRGSGNDPQARLQGYLGRVSDAYESITSRKPSSVPMAVTALASATGPDLSTDVLSHVYLIDVPRSTMSNNMPADTGGSSTGGAR